MEDEVRAVLVSDGFTNEEIRLETDGGGRVRGLVVSPRFRGQSQVERQEFMSLLLKEKLSPESALRIVIVLTMTPDEVGDDVRV